MPRTLPLALLLLALMPAAAGAATVSVRQGVPVTLSDELFYVAEPGEANSLQIVFDPVEQRVRVSDPGATIVAGESCTSVDEHVAECAPRAMFSSNLLRADAQLGDLDDTLVTEAPLRRGTLSANGGAGNDSLSGGDNADVLSGGPGDDTVDAGLGADILDGGGGRDDLDAGPGPDQLADGDRDGAPAGSGLDADQLDGGAGFDTVSYAKRTGPIVLDLRQAPAVEARERDSLSTVEGIVGGEGPDELVGGNGSNYLAGSGGADVLSDRGGAGGPGDVFFGGDGDDRISGGPGPDALTGGAGVDRLKCGAGEDLTVDAQLPEPLDADCEKLYLSAGRGTYHLLAHPVSTSRRSLTFSLRCPGYPSKSATGPRERVPRCRGTLQLREAGFLERRLGRARIDDGGGPSFFRARVRLNALGRRLTGGKNGVVVKASLGGSKSLPAAAWSVRVRR